MNMFAIDRYNAVRKVPLFLENLFRCSPNFLIRFRHYYRLKIFPKGFTDLFDNSTNCRPTHAVGESQ